VSDSVHTMQFYRLPDGGFRLQFEGVRDFSIVLDDEGNLSRSFVDFPDGYQGEPVWRYEPVRNMADALGIVLETKDGYLE
jgi:hypothetical protein